MKILIIILPFLYLSCTGHSGAGKKTAKSGTVITPISDTFKLTCTKPNVDNLHLYNDTVYDYPDYKGHTIKSFDKKKRLMQVFESNLFESNSKKIVSATTIYDTAGHIIYEDKTNGLIRWHCYCYKFDAKGHLIFKEGYSSGEMGIRVSYIYDKDKLIKEITERGGQKIETIF